MERIRSINPNRIQWCCDDHGITPDELAPEVGIAQSRFVKMMAGEDGITFNQLRKIANYFNRGVLFFLEPEPVSEARVRSPQFRTIANQKPDLSSELKALIERVELQRDVYLSLREDLDESDYPHFEPPELPRQNPKRSASNVREWLTLSDTNDFNTYREAVEAKGILVFRSLGYQGAWRIARDSPIVGFSLYDPACPVIMIKKQAYETRQSFTLMHELGHVLLHRSSFIDEEGDLYSYRGRERTANAFAGHLLVPDEFLGQVSDRDRPEDVAEYDNWLENKRRTWGVSGEVILRRLLDSGRLDESSYVSYREWRSTLPIPEQSRGSRQYRHREPKHIFGEQFVRTVLDALHARQVTLTKASTYLDNLKIKDVHALEAHLADL